MLKSSPIKLCKALPVFFLAMLFVARTFFLTTGTRSVQEGRLNFGKPSVLVHEHQSLQDILTVVFIEIRCHAGILVVLQSTMRHLYDNKVRLMIWHSSENELFLKNLIDANPFLKKCSQEDLFIMHRFDPVEFGHTGRHYKVSYKGSYWYNTIMKAESFWKSIPTNWMINLQSDTLICKSVQSVSNLIQRATYIGGLSFKRRSPDPETNITIQKGQHLNGGFSLRSIPWSLDCIQRFKDTEVYEEKAEDSFWNYCKDHSPLSEPLTELDVYSFSSDNGLTQCFTHPTTRLRTCPFGTHKPWKKRRMGNYKELGENCPGLDLLQNNQKRIRNQTLCKVPGMDGTVSISCSCGL